MYATCLPSRIPFSCMHAGGWLRFVAKNTNAQNSCFGSSHALGKGNQPSPFPEGVQHCMCVALYLIKASQMLGEGSSLSWRRARCRKKCLLVLLDIVVTLERS